MIFTILIAFFSLFALIILHELGHFLVARKFGVKVEEFGVGLPPRLLGKKVGETIYSLNLLPFGAFVKIEGEEGETKSERSFGAKPVWQRALIVLAGVVSFWLVSAIIFSFMVATSGIPSAVSDEEENINNPKVQIIAVAPDSPAEAAGIKLGDSILKGKSQKAKVQITKVKEVQEFTAAHPGEEIILTIQRGKETFDVSLTPRESPPEGQGAMGVGLARVAQISYPWYKAPLQGVLITGKVTVGIIEGFGRIFSDLISKREMPPGAQVVGPIGIFGEMSNAFNLGINYFLYFISVISIYLAIFNILPVPALDGGKLLFLGIEKIKGSPVNPKIEQKITAAFFVILIALMILVSIKDVAKIF